MTSLAELLDYLTVDERTELDEHLAALRPTRTFREFASSVNPKYKWYRHCVTLAEALQGVADGTIKRLMVFEPPRHGKSEEVSRLFAGYYLERHPDRWVGLAAYAAGLAFTLSRNARENYLRAGNVVNPQAGGVEHWETTDGGGMWAAGVGGPITGKGFHLGIIDDPVKNAEEANSETIREKHKDWWRSTFYTRGEPDAAIVVVQTRWHEDDLSGWLLAQELDEDPEGWHILNLEAIRTDEATTWPTSCTVIADWRKPGEALCPERYSLEKLKKMERRVGSYYFGALFQQRPTAMSGDVFKREWWQSYTALPTQFDRIIQSWDMAFKDEETSDYVSGQVWGVKGLRFYLLDRVKERMSFTASCNAVRGMTAKWPRATGKYVEDKANGPAVISALRRECSGMVGVKPDGGKLARAYAVQPVVEAGQCYLPDPSIAPWVEDFIRECAQFPRGAHDDDVDAMTQALNVLARGARAEEGEDEWPEVVTEEMRLAQMNRDLRPGIQRREQNRRMPDGLPAHLLDPDFGAY